MLNALDNSSYFRILSITLFCICLIAVFVFIIIITKGAFIYPLDDTYIHLTIAQNLVQDGGWGISPNYFASISSSLLWTFSLSFIFLIFGVSQFVPLFLSVILTTLLLYAVFQILNKHHFSPLQIFWSLSALFFFTPLLPLIYTGLEHALHSLLTLLTVVYAANSMNSSQNKSSRLSLLCGLFLLNSMARYEALFVLLIISGLFLLRKRWWFSVAILASGLLPLIFYGIFSLGKGWYFLPNSILLKGRSPDFNSFQDFLKWLIEPWQQAYFQPHLILLMLISAGIILYQIKKRYGFWKTPFILNVIFLLNTALHIQFARLGWFYRYEAYLMVMGFVAILISLKRLFPNWLGKRSSPFKNSPIWGVGIAMVLIVSLVVLGIRGVTALVQTPLACKNIYEQQYQMGLFLKSYYQGEAVAANDIGAINFLADIKCIDLWGLANMDIAKAKRDGSYGPKVIQEVAGSQRVKIAIVYDDWYIRYGGLPKTWSKVAEWTIQDNVVCGSDTVSFYAVDPSHKDSLLQNLKTFSQAMPKDVIYRFIE